MIGQPITLPRPMVRSHQSKPLGGSMHPFTTKILAPLAALALVAGLTALQPSHSFAQAGSKLDDPTIVAIFDAANTFDIQTGSLAASRGHSKAVREFGKMLVRDHRNVRTQGRELAASLKVTPTRPRDFALAKAHAAAMTSLRKARGRGFDPRTCRGRTPRPPRASAAGRSNRG